MKPRKFFGRYGTLWLELKPQPVFSPERSPTRMVFWWPLNWFALPVAILYAVWQWLKTRRESPLFAALVFIVAAFGTMLLRKHGAF